jgi:hypothetical protein
MAAPKKSRSTRKTKAETAQESQQEPDQDSELQTPQPDQPHPTVTEQREGEPRKDDRQSPEQPDQAPDQRPEQPDSPEEYVKHVVDGGRSFRADVFVEDPHDVEKQRQSELDEEREKHNRRTGDASLA